VTATDASARRPAQNGNRSPATRRPHQCDLKHRNFRFAPGGGQTLTHVFSLQDLAERASAVRLAPVTGPVGQSEIAVQTVRCPREGDTGLETSDLDVFLDEDLVEPLNAAVLDPEETGRGANSCSRS
jgi:hypothetical protein